MEDTNVRLINCRLHLFRSSAYSFSSQNLLLFLKSSRSCVLLLPTPFISFICPSMASWRRQFLLRIRPIKLSFLRRILFRSALFSPIRSGNCSISDDRLIGMLLVSRSGVVEGDDAEVFILMVFTCSLLSWCNISSPIRENNNVVVFPFPSHIFIPLANLWLIRLKG